MFCGNGYSYLVSQLANDRSRNDHLCGNMSNILHSLALRVGLALLRKVQSLSTECVVSEVISVTHVG